MKIAIVLDSVTRGGAERQAIYAAGELARRGCQVELIYYHRAEHEHDLSRLRDVKVTYLPKHGTYVRFLWRFSRHLKAGQYDVVHGFKASPSIYVGLLGRPVGISAVIGGIRAEYDCTGLIRLAHKFIDRRMAGWIVNSRASAKSVVEALGSPPDHLFVVSNGIDPAVFQSALPVEEAKKRLGLAPNSLVVSILARLHKQKNHSLFLAAAERVVKQYSNAEFLIVGDGELKGELQSETAARGLSRKVHFLGTRADVANILRATDVVALTSHYEGLANVLLEAMCVGIPVVTTAYAGVDELVTNHREGFVVPLGDGEAVAERIAALFGNGELRRELGERGKQTVRDRFSIEAMGGQLLGVYEECLRRAK